MDINVSMTCLNHMSTVTWQRSVCTRQSHSDMGSGTLLRRTVLSITVQCVLLTTTNALYFSLLSMISQAGWKQKYEVHTPLTPVCSLPLLLLFIPFQSQSLPNAAGSGKPCKLRHRGSGRQAKFNFSQNTFRFCLKRLKMFVITSLRY